MAIITISRQVAALGDEVAGKVAQLLNYKFITRKDIEKRIIELGFPESKMSKFDERKPGFFASLTKDRDEYLNYVQYAILEAAEQKNVVIIGRGAFAVLQNVPNVISVRLIADDKTRLARLQKEFTWNEKQAMQRITESDTNRTGFHNSFYNMDINDPTLFHMILNTGILSVDEAAFVLSDFVEKRITVSQEEEGNLLIEQLLQAQKVVNKLSKEYKIHIEYMHATIQEKTVILHGVSDSSAVVEQALKIIEQEMPGYEAKSAVSIVQDFKTFQ